MVKMNFRRLWIWKSYDTIDWHGMWQMLRVYEVTGKLLKAVLSFYVMLMLYLFLFLCYNG